MSPIWIILYIMQESIEQFPFQSSSAALNSMLWLLYKFKIQLHLITLPITAPSLYSPSPSLSPPFLFSLSPLPPLRSLLSLSPSSLSLPFPSLPPPTPHMQKCPKKPACQQQCSSPLATSHLEHLDLSGCHLITDVGLRWVVSWGGGGGGD